MDSKTRAKLRALATREDTIAQIGKEGATEAVAESLGRALTARELIKISVLRNCDEDVRTLAEELAAATKSEVVATIGSKIILYRKSDKQGVKHVLEDAAAKDPRRKPNAVKKTNFKGEHYSEDARTTRDGAARKAAARSTSSSAHPKGKK